MNTINLLTGTLNPEVGQKAWWIDSVLVHPGDSIVASTAEKRHVELPALEVQQGYDNEEEESGTL